MPDVSKAVASALLVAGAACSGRAPSVIIDPPPPPPPSRSPEHPQFEELRRLELPTYADFTTALALGDVDGDGDPDLVVANLLPQSQLYLNDGRGHFTDATAANLPSSADSALAIALGDVDGDGDSDLVFGMERSLRSRLYLNDGRGQFTDATMTHLPLDSDDTHAVALGDVDGDGDPDLVLGNSPDLSTGQNRLYLNDGTGVFSDATATRLPPDRDHTQVIVLGDVDGDGDLDLLVGNAGEQNRLHLNDGTGTFTDATAAQMPTRADPTAALALTDLDGDGAPDLVVANYDQQSRLYRNDGRGEFIDETGARLPARADKTLDVAAGDVDGDGDVDLVFATEYDSFYPLVLGQNRLYTNDGSGAFTDLTSTVMPFDNDSTVAAALGDVDADGDLDLVFGNAPLLQNKLYTNLLRQLYAPATTRPGVPYRLDVYARYGVPHEEDVAHLFLSTGTASLPLPPWGTFGLDPTRLAVVPPFVLPRPAGVDSFFVTVPNAPSLIGVTIHAQALLVQEPEAHLTNLTSDTILP